MAIRGAMRSKTVRTGFSIKCLKCCPTVNSQPRKYLIKSLRVNPGMFSIAAEDSAVWVRRLKGIGMQGALSAAVKKESIGTLPWVSSDSYRRWHSSFPARPLFRRSVLSWKAPLPSMFGDDSICFCAWNGRCRDLRRLWLPRFRSTTSP